MTEGDTSFRAYHRARLRMSLARLVAALGVFGALAVGLTAFAAALPPAPEVPPEQVTATVEGAWAPAEDLGQGLESSSERLSHRVFEPGSEHVGTGALPAPAPAIASSQSTPPEPAPTGLPVTGAASWAIAVDTRGYQDEIDQCLWVRMDLGGHAPIVGAHNYCGGDQGDGWQSHPADLLLVG